MNRTQNPPKEYPLYDTPEFRLAGDRGLLMAFGETIDPGINARIRAMASHLSRELPQGVEEIIPTYCSLILVYDPAETCPDILIPELTAMNDGLDDESLPEPEVVELPVCYHPDLGPDLLHVAEVHGLTPEAVVDIHTKPLYPVYMIGFTPGFPYLGGLDERLHTGRLSSPRTHVPAGSVGIANNQTGIYPIASPGGWQLIGQCPVKLFDPDRENPILLKAGSLLKFRAVSMDEFVSLKEENR
ncbi:MAG TPA: allophanate hydrolase [Desulfobacteraceae bacterium]|nr:allophanate hydrolase [Desulfobacteraceae bacterium]|tara:strand:+ start:748 stop:1476 length:729 start_codon:yes stop_codon:yes gene_type:complete